MIEKWLIRKATANDLPYFIDSLQQIYLSEFDKEVFIMNFRKICTTRNYIAAVAENTLGNIIGCIIGVKVDSHLNNNNSIQIKDFFVTPKYRKYHLADDLYNYIETRAIKLGAFNVEVLCNPVATTTQTFYLRKKFIADKKMYKKFINY
jgi:predicted N-acetyltransferase YhbS